MTNVYESENYPIKGENGEVEGYESVKIFKFKDVDEAEEFDILSNSEKLKELGLKEASTPNSEHATLRRYFIDNSDAIIIVKETTIIY